jgi:hypothetical protein
LRAVKKAQSKKRNVNVVKIPLNLITKINLMVIQKSIVLTFLSQKIQIN